MPLTFVPLPDGRRMKIYGSLGNVWIEKPEVQELPGNDWWYWQIGVVTSVWGLDVATRLYRHQHRRRRLRLDARLRRKVPCLGDKSFLRPAQSHR
jgi:hypothetical protein